MKILTFVFCIAFSSSLPAQTQVLTFKSTDGTFQFKHSDSLVRCMQDYKNDERGSWSTEECLAYSPVCDDLGSQGAVTLVCFAYPKARFKEYPGFEAAAFWVAEVKGATSESVCLTAPPDWPIDERGSGSIATINGVKFKIFEPFSAGTSHYLDSHMYRTFHRGSCYELVISIATVNTAVFDPPVKELSDQDWRNINKELSRCLYSFRFL